MLLHIFSWFKLHNLSTQFIEMIVTELTMHMCYNFTIHIQQNVLDIIVYVSNNDRL